MPTDAAAVASCGRSVKELQARIVGLSRSLEDDSSRPQMSAEEAMDRYQTEQLRYQQCEEQLDAWQKSLLTIGEMMRKRDESLRRLRFSLGCRVTEHFRTILETRGFGVSWRAAARGAKWILAVGWRWPVSACRWRCLMYFGMLSELLFAHYAMRIAPLLVYENIIYSF